MPMKPLPVWQKKLASMLKDASANLGKDPMATDKAWQAWITEVADGIQFAPPYTPSNGTLSPKGTTFAPLKLPPMGTPITAATVYSNAWFAWYMSITWAIPAPVPPFSAIMVVTSSSMGAATAKTKLMADLLKEFATPSKDASKYDAMAKAFFDATMNAGVMLVGLGIGAPPPPLSIPQHKVF